MEPVEWPQPFFQGRTGRRGAPEPGLRGAGAPRSPARGRASHVVVEVLVGSWADPSPGAGGGHIQASVRSCRSQMTSIRTRYRRRRCLDPRTDGHRWHQLVPAAVRNPAGTRAGASPGRPLTEHVDRDPQPFGLGVAAHRGRPAFPVDEPCGL